MHFSRLYWKQSWNTCSIHLFTAVWIHIRKPHVFWRSQEPPGRHRCGEFCSSFVFDKCVVFDGGKCATVKQRVWRSNYLFTTVLKAVVKYGFNTLFTTVWIYMRKPHVFPSIGEVRSRQGATDAASFVRVVWTRVLFLMGENFATVKYRRFWRSNPFFTTV